MEEPADIDYFWEVDSTLPSRDRPQFPYPIRLFPLPRVADDRYAGSDVY